MHISGVDHRGNAGWRAPCDAFAEVRIVPMSRGVWLSVGAGVAALVSFLFVRGRVRSSRPNVGAVSDRWVTEHRTEVEH
ncbi:MAG: hypothetical protein DMF97_10385 [Acidobacteria bacterium]|nr:MAG: hypothetical protein DMF97_10385 [Acidobacteriota bacterium]